jgi:hypothetical protein
MSDFSKTIDNIMEPLGFERTWWEDGFYPLPESEWSVEDVATGNRVVCKRNEADPKRLDVFVQFHKPIEYITIACDFSF